MLKKTLSPYLDDEIYLRDIINFLIESWKLILAMGISGVLVGATYVALAPNIYQATAQIEMAKFKVKDDSHLGASIEDPNLLIARMNLPSSYDKTSIVACGYDGKDQAAERLQKMVKINLVKGTQMVELKVNGLSQEQSIQCAQSIFNNIKESQKMISKIIVEEAKTRLADYSLRLKDAKAFITNYSNSDPSMILAYLSIKNDMKQLADQIDILNNHISFALNHPTKLVSPIYSSEHKVSPRREIVLAIGLFCGLIFGLFLMIGLRSYRI